MMRHAALFVLMLALYSAALVYAYEYKVTGFNLGTNERVLGHISDSTQNGTLEGTIWDREGTFPVRGVWSGKGLMTLHSTTTTFEVEVVE